MRLIPFWLIVCALLLVGKAPAPAAESDGGKRMYLQYCASCHGADGIGNGSVSRYLKIKVPDLTQIARNHKGIFPLDDVMATIDGRRSVRAHGERDMPVWGESFAKELEEKKYTELTTLLRAKLIAEYIATLQKR